MLKVRSCIFEFNIIASIIYVAETLLIFIWEKVLSHLGLMHCRNLSAIVTDRFEAGALRLIRT